MVGDHPLDIEAGHVHGMRTAAVLTGTGSEADLRAAGPDYVFCDVTQILSLLG
jgi:phosphoglycolate phosphatase-like HAD superfamily hydrolase